MANGDPTSARNLKTDQLPRARPERAEPGSAQLSAEGLPTLSQWRTSTRERCARLSKDKPPRAGQSGPDREVSSYQPRIHTHSVSGDGNSNVGLGAALQDAEKRNQSAYQTLHAQELAEGDSARGAAAPEAQCRLKNCAEPTA